LKIKNVSSQELVIGGWLPGQKGRSGRLGALLIGYYAPGEHGTSVLRYAGRVGTGFNDHELDRLGAKLQARARKTSPFVGTQPPREARFVRPDMVAEIEFREWTRDGSLRHPSYKGLREDKDAREVVRERSA
jgi:bifunctional non-homologous end joining protein LigD